MPTPNVYPVDTRAEAFRWAEARLRARVRLVEHWYAHAGPGSFPVSVDRLPNGVTCGLLTPSYEPMEPEVALGDGRRSYRSPVVVNVALRVVGGNCDNPAAVWRQCELALCPTDRAERRAAHESGKAAGISWVELMQPAGGGGTDPLVIGSVRLVVYVNR